MPDKREYVWKWASRHGTEAVKTPFPNLFLAKRERNAYENVYLLGGTYIAIDFSLLSIGEGLNGLISKTAATQELTKQRYGWNLFDRDGFKESHELPQA